MARDTAPPLPRFYADTMLARLARFLRAAGFDVAGAPAGEADDHILRRARRERRVVITRDLRFPGGEEEKIVIESREIEEQMVEVLRRIGGVDLERAAFSRCMECNTPVVREERPDDVPEGIGGPFTRCPACGRLYWEGSHVDRVRERLRRVGRKLEEARREEERGMPPPIGRPEYDRFLKEAFPLLGLSWRGYRRVRLGLRTRIRARLIERGLRGLDGYLDLLRREEGERWRLGALLAVTITRFFRDRERWFRFGADLFPELERLAAGGAVRAWSIGCASGEEPYTLRIVWRESGRSDEGLAIAAGDLSGRCLERAGRGIYPESSIHNMPPALRERYLTPAGDEFLLTGEIRRSVTFGQFDWRSDGWPGGFHWILCRNGIFTYLDEPGRTRTLRRIEGSLVPGGYLWIGGNERLPAAADRWERRAPSLYCFSPGETSKESTSRSRRRAG